MEIVSLVLSIFATIISVAITLRDKFEERFHQETTVRAVVTNILSARHNENVLFFDCVTANYSKLTFAVTDAHFWIETKPMITSTYPIDGRTKLPEQNHSLAKHPVFMWSENNGVQEIDHHSDSLPIEIPSNSAKHFVIAINMKDVSVPEGINCSMKLVLSTSRKGHSIVIENEELTQKLITLEKYLKE